MPHRGDEDAAARPWQRRLMVGIAVVVGLHSAVLALWLAPVNPARDAVGTTTLASYVEPYFQQSWDGLDPRSQRVDEAFRIRANVKVDGGQKMRVTPWIDLTKVEGGPLRHDVDPARVHVIARRLATNLNAVMFAFEPAQRKLVRANYITTPISTLEQRLDAAGPDDTIVQTYLTYDQMATEFASMYASARWPDDTILEVQYLVGRRTVPPRGEKGSRVLADVDYRWFAFGYRKAYKGSYEAQLVFDSYVKK